MDTTILVTVLIVFGNAISISNTANILMYQSVASKSHTYTFIPVAKELTKRGHNVTLISPFPSDKKQDFHDIGPDALIKLMREIITGLDPLSGRVNHPFFNPFGFIENLYAMPVFVCEAFLNSENTKYIVDNETHFDLIIVDTVYNECIFGLGAIQNTTVIYYSTTIVLPFHTSALGLPFEAVYMPHAVTHFTGSGDYTKLLNRVYYVGFEVFRILFRRYITFPAQESLWKERTGISMPSFEEMGRQIGLHLVNAHFSAKLPQPYTPGLIDVGGIHMQPNKPLPKKLQKVLDDSGDAGFLLFALGTVTSSETMPKHLFQMFIDVFNQLPQRVIWKFDLPKEKQTDLPPNVFMYDWLPQSDILAHPKCRGFITHGGMMGFIESVHHGIPVVVIPIFAEQDLQAVTAQSKELGIYVEISTITKEKLLHAVTEVINNPKYKTNMMKRSAFLHDRITSPLDTAVYWVEWAIRYKDTSILLPEARNWSWFSFYLVDVWLVIGSFVIVSIIISYFILKTVFKVLTSLLGGKKEKQKKL